MQIHENPRISCGNARESKGNPRGSQGEVTVNLRTIDGQYAGRNLRDLDPKGAHRGIIKLWEIHETPREF